MAWVLTIDIDDGDVDSFTDRLWSVGTTGVALLDDHRPGTTRLVAGFDAETTATAARATLGGSIAAVDPTSWVAPEPNTIEIAGRSITIDAGQSFGHGGHPTTRLCLDAIRRHLLPGQRMLDVGCGSGVLSLAAGALGAEVSAIDIDPIAVRAARANAVANGIDLEVSTTPVDELAGPFEIVVANLLLADLEPIGRTLASLSSELVIVSGSLTEQRHRVGMALGPDLVLVDQSTEAGWFGAVYRREQP